MREFKMFQADAFTDTVFAGNPAAVLILKDWLPEAGMQAIAAENNLAETAFVIPDAEGYAIRWFTPAQEVAFCGHATLASAHILATEYGATDPIRLSTRKVGTLIVTPEGNGRYGMDLPALSPTPLQTPEIFATLFPGGWVAACRNFENIFVELPSAEDVLTYMPDLAAIETLGPQGLCITAAGGHTHDGKQVDFVSRYFAPAAGIDEDPVTGSTHSTLIPYWSTKLGARPFSAFQASPRGGYLEGCLAGDRVKLTGRAATFMRATICLPD
ncbi:MAG: PhzF family phenazine biosynthesis protein [Albidovulum sp.]|uniref:PhzF family phenazine biosynthesis protein n=1 Tax=Albidovulum sp. TaxID=1872424 RepID=UPI003CA80679